MSAGMSTSMMLHLQKNIIHLLERNCIVSSTEFNGLHYLREGFHSFRVMESRYLLGRTRYAHILQRNSIDDDDCENGWMDDDGWINGYIDSYTENHIDW